MLRLYEILTTSPNVWGDICENFPTQVADPNFALTIMDSLYQFSELDSDYYPYEFTVGWYKLYSLPLYARCLYSLAANNLINTKDFVFYLDTRSRVAIYSYLSDVKLYTRELERYIPPSHDKVIQIIFDSIDLSKITHDDIQAVASADKFALKGLVALSMKKKDYNTLQDLITNYDVRYNYVTKNLTEENYDRSIDLLLHSKYNNYDELVMASLNYDTLKYVFRYIGNRWGGLENAFQHYYVTLINTNRIDYNKFYNTFLDAGLSIDFFRSRNYDPKIASWLSNMREDV